MNAKPTMFALAACFLAAASGFSFRAATDEPAPAAWNNQAAAGYLDARQAWWMHWPKAARDHDTFCISCHTVVPDLLARSACVPHLRNRPFQPTNARSLTMLKSAYCFGTRLSLSTAMKKLGP